MRIVDKFYDTYHQKINIKIPYKYNQIHPSLEVAQHIMKVRDMIGVCNLIINRMMVMKSILGMLNDMARGLVFQVNTKYVIDIPSEVLALQKEFIHDMFDGNHVWTNTERTPHGVIFKNTEPCKIIGVFEKDSSKCFNLISIEDNLRFKIHHNSTENIDELLKEFEVSTAKRMFSSSGDKFYGLDQSKLIIKKSSNRHAMIDFMSYVNNPDEQFNLDMEHGSEIEEVLLQSIPGLENITVHIENEVFCDEILDILKYSTEVMNSNVNGLVLKVMALLANIENSGTVFVQNNDDISTLFSESSTVMTTTKILTYMINNHINGVISEHCNY